MNTRVCDKKNVLLSKMRRNCCLISSAGEGGVGTFSFNHFN